MVVIQYKGSIVAASLNTHRQEIICESGAMVRQHMVRGYKEKIFYCESHGSTQKITQVELDSETQNLIKKKELWQLNGSHIVAFELDSELIVDEREEEIKQRLFVMDDQQKIYVLENDDNLPFTVINTIDFSHHKSLRFATNLRDKDWIRLHMSNRTLTYGNRTYNLANN